MNWQKLLTSLLLRGAGEYSDDAKLHQKVSSAKGWSWLLILVGLPYFLMGLNEMLFGEGDLKRAQWFFEQGLAFAAGGGALIGLRNAQTKTAETKESDLVAIARKAMEEMKANEK